MNNSRGTVIGLVAVVVVALGALVFFLTRQTGGADTGTVEAMQKEAAKQVPAGLGAPTKEQAQQGLMMMGRGKTSTAPGPGIAPP